MKGYDLSPTVMITGDLDVNSSLRMTVSKGDYYQQVQIKVDYDGFMYTYYMINPSNRDDVLEQRWTDFDGEGCAKVFLKYILRKSILEYIIKNY